jgi:hypothetical protein
VSAASDFLNSWILKAENPSTAPSITVVIAQRWPGIGLPWHPGITGYGFGIDPEKVTDSAGNPGIRFGAVYTWFSDRGANYGGNSLTDVGQQFITSENDESAFLLLSRPPLVVMNARSITWGGEWTAETELIDEPSQQLLFSGIPGAGPGAPPALMIVSFAETGDFGFV